MQVQEKWLLTEDQMEVRSQQFYSYFLTSHMQYLIGLLVGACINRAPEGTFGAAVAEVGVMDLLKVCMNECVVHGTI